MSRTQGYFLYNINSDRHEEHWFIYPHKVYSTLQGAKNAKIIKAFPYDLPNSVWAIIPIKYAYDRKSKIKYMLIDGQWTTELNEKIANAFYKWRGTETEVSEDE